MSRKYGRFYAAVCMGAALVWGSGCGGGKTKTQHDGDEDGHTGGHQDEHGAGPAKTDFASYSLAMAAIEKHRAHVAEVIEKKELLKVHKAAKPIEQIAKTLADLAMKEGSGVPQDQDTLREVNLTATALAETWARIDAAGDKGDEAATKKVYEEIVDLIKTLRKHAKAVKEEHHEEKGDGDDGHGAAPSAQKVAYFCPMKCEGSKTYADAATKCPKCNMKLAMVKSVAGGEHHKKEGHHDD